MKIALERGSKDLKPLEKKRYTCILLVELNA